MTATDLIGGILTREGGYREDRGGPTNFGITSRSWGSYRGLNRPSTREEVKAITRDQAVAFYESQYVKNSPYAGVAYEALRVQLIDFAVNSGNGHATRWLQRVLRVPVTSVMDDRTNAALATVPNYLVNEALIAARVRMLTGGITDGTIQLADFHGLVSRAMSFSEIQL